MVENEVSVLQNSYFYAPEQNSYSWTVNSSPYTIDGAVLQ